MRGNWLVLIVVTGFIFLLQIGCSRTDVAGTGRLESAKELSQAHSSPADTAKAVAKPQVTKPQADKLLPQIAVENTIHDFGEVGPGTNNVCEFKFTNIGKGLLKIKRIQSTCGCTVPELTKTEYAPGESGQITVRYNAPKSQSTVLKHLYIHSNAANNPKVSLAIKAKVVLKVAFEPKRLNLSLKEENAGCGQITIKSLDGRPFSIRRFRSTGDSITADIDGSVKATEFVLQPKVDIEKLKKSLNGRIEINLTHPQGHTVIIAFNTLPRFKISQPTIIILNAEPQKPMKRTVWILNNYGEDFEIESTSSKNGIIKLLNQERVDNRYKFELEITPPAVENKRMIFTDEFSVNIKGGEKLKINCRGFYARGS